MSEDPGRGEQSSNTLVLELGNQRVDLIQRTELLDLVDGVLRDGGVQLRLASANLDHVYRFRDTPELFWANDGSRWLVLLDGMPLVREARRRSGRRWDQLAGSDLLPELLGLCERRGARVGFLGGSSELCERLPTALAAQWPALQVTGHWAPERAEVEDPTASSALATEIASAGVDLLVVGLGKPRQERWIARHGERTGARVCVAFGAASDFIAGVRPRAPRLVSKLGLEWLYRLLLEPRRLAKRYLVEGPVSLLLVRRG